MNRMNEMNEMNIIYKFIDNDEDYITQTFDDIVNLENYNDIRYIDCGYNELNVLPPLPTKIEILWCEYNLLNVLPPLPESLKELYCYRNRLKELPNLPKGLTELWCFNNKLTFLQPFPTTLIEAYCNNNRLQLVPVFLDSLVIDYSGNPVYNYIQNKCGGYIDMYHDENKIFANKISGWFLECRENPIYKYCRDRLNREYDELKEDKDNTILL